jgi:hypothetical protein
MPHYGASYRNYWKMQEPKPLIQEGRKAMTKQDIWLMRMKQKDATLHLKKGRSWVEKKSLRIRNVQRNEHTKMVGEKAMKLDSTKGRKKGR